MDTPEKLPIARPGIAAQQLASAQQMQSMFEGDVKKRQEHLDTLEDGEEKNRYAVALKTAQKSLEDQKTHVVRAQKAFDATPEGKAAPDNTTAETES